MIEWVQGPFGWHWEYPRPHWPMTDVAQAIEAQRAGTTKIGPVADESAVAKPCAQRQ
jgi:hypothetical protein